MKRIIAFICAFFMLSSGVTQAEYTGTQIYKSILHTFNWIEENISPLGDTDSIASDYCVMAMRRFNRPFDYNKYAKITASREPETVQDAHRIITANTASGGTLSNEFVAENTYRCNFTRASDKADSIIALQSGEYKIKSKSTDIDKLAVGLVLMQNSDGSFDGDVLATSKSIIALSFFSGNAYIVKGKEMGEKYRYDINSAILRGVDYLQNNKNPDFGFGSVKNTAYAVMALDAAGVDADNDPGFSDGSSSTLKALMSFHNEDGSFGENPDDSAVAICALVSHLRAMQGNSAFFALRTEDMPYNPEDYVEDTNRSGEGLKTGTEKEIKVTLDSEKIESDTTEKPYELTAVDGSIREPHDTDKKASRILPIIVIIAAVILTAAVAVGFVMYVVYIRPKKIYHDKKSDDGDD